MWVMIARGFLLQGRFKKLSVTPLERARERWAVLPNVCGELCRGDWVSM